MTGLRDCIDQPVRLTREGVPALVGSQSHIVLISLLLFLGSTALFGATWAVPLLPSKWLTGTPLTN
jgi:hypothetical protein